MIMVTARTLIDDVAPTEPEGHEAGRQLDTVGITSKSFVCLSGRRRPATSRVLTADTSGPAGPARLG